VRTAIQKSVLKGKMRGIIVNTSLFCKKMNKNKPYFLALNRMPGMGPLTVLKLLKQWPSLGDLFALSQSNLEKAGLSEKLASVISSFNMKEIEQDLHWETQNQHQHCILTWEDNRYPALLKEIHDPPVVLYARGDLASLEQPMLAMVGTRKPSTTGAETSWYFANQLAQCGITIVSGLAEGIDAKAHQGCLKAEARTIAVMGTGMDSIYPRSNSQLASKIVENGLLLTEFPLKSRANAGHFPRRNRIISGLSKATLVVEAAMKSGSLITARLALEQNRDVLAIPGSIHNVQARGCHYLLQQGAKLVTSIQDVLDELGMPQLRNSVLLGTSIGSLAISHRNLVECIGFEVTTIDKIIERSGLSLDITLSNLAQLEIAGLVKAVPGGYARCILPDVHLV
jgi:DNA processing protein